MAVSPPAPCVPVSPPCDRLTPRVIVSAPCDCLTPVRSFPPLSRLAHAPPAASGHPRRHCVVTRVHPRRPGNDRPPAACAFPRALPHKRAPAPHRRPRRITSSPGRTRIVSEMPGAPLLALSPSPPPCTRARALSPPLTVVRHHTGAPASSREQPARRRLPFPRRTVSQTRTVNGCGRVFFFS